MSNDIRPFGAGDGVGFYWIRRNNHPGGSHRAVIAVDEFGNVTSTPLNANDDGPVPTEAEAVIEHLAPALEQADANLNRYRERKAEEPEPEPKPKPVDPATRRFLGG